MADKTWMTQESYDRLKEELRHLEEVERPAVATMQLENNSLGMKLGFCS